MKGTKLYDLLSVAKEQGIADRQKNKTPKCPFEPFTPQALWWQTGVKMAEETEKANRIIALLDNAMKGMK